MTADQILSHHLVAFGNNDLDEIMKDYTEESIVFAEKGVVSGIEAIREFFTEMFLMIPSGSEFEMMHMNVVLNVSHIIWSSKSSTADIPFGTDTFVFEQDKIRFHTVSAYLK
ncbi:nuclear transport factor 2 family protein [Pedobacter psychroterrae]|uniref:Nuclear transport factor 2 family protein n=1 Tax=Pedobacter psychroterrae TaxID=2530453 RepID=A0A4R0ND41_9SPHI|nr:nuclear transport factor 2 family protein [Pedobacter psychroterrae]TCC98271.1 nuclear transport factor 2 family protein [Pedobacter psychroterrae]